MAHLVSTAILALLLAPVAASQIDLPDKDGKDTTPPGLKNDRTGDIAPHLTCTVCYEANYTAKVDWESKNGMQKTFCRVCQAPRLHHLPKQGGGKGRGVDLPLGERAGAQGAPTARVDQPETGPLKINQDPVNAQLTRASGEILSALAGVDSVDDAIAMQATETLLALGGPGRVAARVALADDHGPTMLTGVRVLLRTGLPEDAEVVVNRLRRKMPNRAAGAALGELVALDPVRATPRLLCELLEHPQQPVRSAAQRRLREIRIDDALPYLIPRLESSRSDTRMRAIDLIAAVDHPLRRDLLLSRIADPRAKVARRVVEALTIIDDPALDQLLLSTAFGERWVLRSGAFALLAIVEREDDALRPILTDAHVENLLRGLDSNDPFVSGACASALAGIGFRSESSDVSVWLDRPVPERLVRVVSGFEFFDDYEALRATALRRLKMVTGTTFGTDGPAWAEWWLAGRETFVASRAVIPIDEGAERRFSVALSDHTTGESFILLGPDLAEQAPVDRGEVFYLDPAAALDLLRFLEGEGIFGLSRLPGARGALTDKGVVVDVRVGDRGKNFVIGDGVHAPWLDHMVGRARALAERNYWQRFPQPGLHYTRLALYRSEGAWWGGDHDAETRATRLKRMILDRAAALPPIQRDAEIAALTEVYKTPEFVVDTDFPALLGLLSNEPWFGGRAKQVARLARKAAGLTAEVPDEATAARLWMLVDILHETFTAEAMDELAHLIDAAGNAFALEASSDHRPILRAVSTVRLGRDGAAEDGEVERVALLGLLEDAVVDVEIAAVHAAGVHRIESLRSELLLRARLGKADVRVASLEALGFLGGVDIRDTLTTALTEEDSRFRLAAAKGLANLRDPETSALLVSLLRSRAVPGMAPIVREALYDLGVGAHDELFLAMRSPSPELRREAALLLARQTVPACAPVLMELLASNPVDSEIIRELTILTCVDLRREVDPAEAWFRWWDSVKRDDPLAWLRAAAEARNITAPGPEQFDEAGSRDAIGFLVQLMRLDEDFLAERARRALEDVLGRDVEQLPPFGYARDKWLNTMLEVLEEQR